MIELMGKVIEWAKDRNIIEGSTPEKQLEKLAAELVELTVAITKDQQSDSSSMYSAEIAEEMGDILVVLTIIGKQLGFELYDCLFVAYEKIKHRKGEMRGGVFVKEADL